MDFERFGDEPTEGAHPTSTTKLTAKAALERLRAGNVEFL